MSEVVEKSITQVIDKEYFDYSIYVLENRAIPSAIDGMKPVHRKILYGMLTDHKGKKTKLSDLGAISRYNYHHGENSAAAAAVTLTAAYNNLAPLFEGHGNFGSRLIQEAAAPRYIYASLSPNFSKYFMDEEVCDENADVDNPEPQCYLPIIPWVLVNGIEGIAVGFACKFLPHKPSDLAKACIAYLQNKKIPELIPTFPEFTGSVQNDVDVTGKYVLSGTINRVKRNHWNITEVPYGMDREGVYNLLMKMEDSGLIEDFEDNCDENGFNFIVKLSTVNDEKCQEDPISYFKLSKSVTENYTTLDESGKLKLFENKSEIIAYFCDYRKKKIREMLDLKIANLKEDIRWLTIKAMFVRDMTLNKINLKTKRKEEWIEEFKTLYSTKNDDGQKLLAIPVVDMTADYIANLVAKIKDKKELLETTMKIDETELFIERLKEIK